MDHLGKVWNLGEGASVDTQIVQGVRTSIMLTKWQQAAKHNCGAGLEHGVPDFSGYKKAMRWLRKQGQWSLATASDKVAIGGATNAGRFQGSLCPA